MYRTDDKQISVLISRVRQAHQCWSLLSFHNYFYKMSDLLGYSKPLTPNKPLQPSYLLHPSLPQPVLSGTGPLIEFCSSSDRMHFKTTTKLILMTIFLDALENLYRKWCTSTHTKPSACIFSWLIKTERVNQ